MESQPDVPQNITPGLFHASRPLFPDEERLVYESVRGNIDAFGALFTYYRPYLNNVANKDAGTEVRPIDADDHVQTTFIKAATAIKDLSIPANNPGILRGWLTLILRNTIRDTKRGWAQSHTAASADLAYPHVEPSVGRSLWHGPVPSVERTVIAAMAAEHAVLQIARIVRQQRVSAARGDRNLRIARMAFIEELPHDVIASELNTNKNIVKQVVKRLRKELKEDPQNAWLYE